MTRRIVTAVLVVFMAVLLAGMVVVGLARNRELAAKVGCRNNLRALALLGTPFSRNDQGQVLKAPGVASATSIWPGTVFNPTLPPTDRLSWVALALPYFGEPSIDTQALASSLDQKAKWNDPPNRTAATAQLRTLQCPGAPILPAAGEPALTMMIGIAGLGKDAAVIVRTNPVSPRRGAFNYDSKTPLELISQHDGISQTLLFGVTTKHNGPWLQGGPATVRGLDDSANHTPLIGPGGQFGGSIPSGTWFAFCDGSVRFFRTATEPRILFALSTLAGGATEFSPDE
jgi:hypothetical protein